MKTTRLPYGAALALLPLLSGCVVSARLPATSLNPFGGLPGTMYELARPTMQVARTPATFGPYRPSEVHRGWVNVSEHPAAALGPGATGSPVLSSLDLPYGQYLTTENSKVRFRFADGQGHEAAVYSATQAITQSAIAYTPHQTRVGEVQRASVVFTALITGPRLDTTSTWNLLLNTPDPTLPEARDPAAVVGLVGSGNRVLLQIKLVPTALLPDLLGRGIAGPTAPPPGGIEVLHQQQRVGYIDFTTAHPSVWLRNDLEPNLRFLTATTISTIMVQASPLNFR